MAAANQRLGEYILIDRIGSGAFGEVWRARHHAWADQIVAVKIPTDSRYASYLQKEGAAIGRLVHPTIVKAIAFDPYHDPAYLVMEYVQGPNLRQLIQTGPLPVADAVAIMKQVLAALHQAHGHNIIHRDIKPENILINEKLARGGYNKPGAVKLSDFGLGSTDIQNPNSIVFSTDRQDKPQIVGSAPYMSPEQRDGGKIDARSDLYSCGIVLFEMLTGRRPAGAESPSDVNPDVPKEIDKVFRKAYAHVDRRFASAEYFFNALASTGGDKTAPTLLTRLPAMPRAIPQVPVAAPPLLPMAAGAAPAELVHMPDPATGAPLNDAKKRPEQARAPVGRAADPSSRKWWLLATLLGLVWLSATAVLLLHTAQDPEFDWEGAHAAEIRRGINAAEDAIARKQPEEAVERYNDVDQLVGTRIIVDARLSEEVARARSHRDALATQIQSATAGAAALPTNSIGMTLIAIAPGAFLMGSPTTESRRYGNEAQHRVTLTKSFSMARTPVTQAQWEAVMGTNPSYFRGDDLPVECVSYFDAVEFCNRLSNKEGGHYRLPTEAEWEYACRAGTATAYYFGDDATRLRYFAWFGGNSGGRTHPVGRMRPNATGLYDMNGDVWEWCSDWYGYYADGDATDPHGPASGDARVVRGGSWGSTDPRYCRSAHRGVSSSDDRDSSLGFRPVLEVD